MHFYGWIIENVVLIRRCLFLILLEAFLMHQKEYSLLNTIVYGSLCQQPTHSCLNARSHCDIFMAWMYYRPSNLWQKPLVYQRAQQFFDNYLWHYLTILFKTLFHSCLLSKFLLPLFLHTEQQRNTRKSSRSQNFKWTL